MYRLLRSRPSRASSRARRAPISKMAPSGAPAASASPILGERTGVREPPLRSTGIPPLDDDLRRIARRRGGGLGGHDLRTRRRGHARPELLDLGVELLDAPRQVADLVAGRHAQAVQR